MTDERWRDPVRASDETMPIRRGLFATLVALGAAGFAGLPIPVAVTKKERKRKRRKKKKCPPKTTLQSCVGLCDAGCSFCYRRNAASNLCGDTLNIPATCAPCSTDNDCLGTSFPYCVSSQTTLSTGVTDEFACPGMPAGFCARPNAC